LELVRREVLPALRARRGSQPARVWSAGCATGEEAYSLAILLAEEGLDKDALVLGTDLSPAALEKARAASYSDWSMRGVSGQFLHDYFRHVRGKRALVDRIRNMVRFERLNLVAPQEYATVGATGMDLILCRNVLMYFDEETAGRIAARLYACLADGGVLLTSGADLLLGEYAPFDIQVTRVGLIYRRRPATAVALPWPLAAPAPAAAKVAPQPGPALERGAFDQVLTIANGMGAFEAEVLAQSALRRQPLDAPLHYLRAALLVTLARDEDAEREAERALYLDPSLAVAHFLLGTILRKRGARPAALRAFRNVRDLCAARPADEAVPAGAGERVGALRSAATAEMHLLEAPIG
jgi:chemotaxis protein methyltransferase CheR